MSREKITNYYLLCTIRLGKKSHIINNLKKDDFNKLFSTREVDLFLRKQGEYYIAREIVVGGDDSADVTKSDSNYKHNRQKIIMIC